MRGKEFFVPNVHGSPFSLRGTPVEQKPGTWNTTRCQVLRGDEVLGEFERGYPSYATETFCPFQLEGRWYSLYSADYTATRVACLEPKFEDWCGEEGDTFGFCPVEHWVPRYLAWNYRVDDKKSYQLLHWENDHSDGESLEAMHADVLRDEQNLNVRLGYANFGFVAGCVWGDDTSWKVQFLDLRGVPSRKLVKSPLFGYVELPHNQGLREAIDLRYNDDLEPGSLRVGIHTPRVFDVSADRLSVKEL